MGRRTEYSKTTRKQVNDQNTWDASAQGIPIVARTTDAYVKPPFIDEDSKSVLALADSLQGFFGAYATMQKAYQPDNEKQAKINAQKDYEKGEYNPEQKNKGFMNANWSTKQAYNQAYGERLGIEYGTEYSNQLAANNYFVDSTNPNEDKRKLRNNLYQKYFGQHQQNTEFLFGANERIIYADSLNDAKFSEAQIKKAKENSLTVEAIIQSDVLKQFAESEADDPQLMVEQNEILYETSASPQGITREEWDTNTVTTTTNTIESIIAEKTVINGIEVYKYKANDAYKMGDKLIKTLKTAGPNGVSYYDMKNSAGKYIYRDMIDTAEAQMLEMINARDKASNQALENLSKQNLSALNAKMYEGEDVLAEINTLERSNQLTPEDATKARDWNRQALSQEWDKREDQDLVFTLEDGIRNFKINIDDVRSYFFNKRITRDTANDLIEQINKRNEAIKKAKESGSKLNEKAYSAGSNYIKDMLSEEDKAFVAEALREYSIRVIEGGDDPWKVSQEIPKKYAPESNKRQVKSLVKQVRYPSEAAAWEAYYKGSFGKVGSKEALVALDIELQKRKKIEKLDPDRKIRRGETE